MAAISFYYELFMPFLYVYGRMQCCNDLLLNTLIEKKFTIKVEFKYEIHNLDRFKYLIASFPILRLNCLLS